MSENTEWSLERVEKEFFSNLEASWMILQNDVPPKKD
jgi:hypothetical protein